jgi:glycosyl transferase family 25
MPIDGAYNIFRRENSDIKTLISAPKLGWQRPSRSDIAGNRFFDKMQSIHFLTAKLRELKYLADRWRS